MPMHRRRVYLDYSGSRRARAEGWLSLSIFLSAAILFLSLLGCLPDLVSATLRWLLPEKLSDELGVASGSHGSMLALPCEVLMMLSGAYLFVTLFIKSQGRHGPH